MGQDTETSGAARGSVAGLSLGRVAGVPLEVHWTFVLLLGFVVLSEESRGPRAVAMGLAWILALFACVVAHELAHCIVAQRRGAKVQRILLLPIGGVSQLDAMPKDPNDEFAVAGPRRRTRCSAAASRSPRRRVPRGPHL